MTTSGDGGNKMKSKEEMLEELVAGGGFIGFGLAKLEKAPWEKDRQADTFTRCIYKWTIYHKNGFVEVDEGKIDKFWSLMCIPSGHGRGIKAGPVGFVNRNPSSPWDWEPILNIEEWDELMQTWLDRCTQPAELLAK